LEKFDRLSLFPSIFLGGNASQNASQPFRQMAVVFQLLSKEQHVMSNLLLIKHILLHNAMIGIVCMMVNCPIMASSKYQIHPMKHSCSDIGFSIFRAASHVEGKWT
jgi:hypothetical protein